MTQSRETFPAAQRSDKLLLRRSQLRRRPQTHWHPVGYPSTATSAYGTGSLGGIADATNLTGCDERFDTVIDSALYQCLDEDGRQAYAAGLYRATC